MMNIRTKLKLEAAKACMREAMQGPKDRRANGYQARCRRAIVQCIEEFRKEKANTSKRTQLIKELNHEIVNFPEEYNEADKARILDIDSKLWKLNLS